MLFCLAMKTKEIVRNSIIKCEDETNVISQALSILSFRPFNMKGQEVEEIIGLVLKQDFQKTYSYFKSVVLVPQNKQSSDIIFYLNDEKHQFDIKSYGGADRLQLSTLKIVLQEIRDKFKDYETCILQQDDKNWLFQTVSKVKIDYNLSFFSTSPSVGVVDIQVFDFESLNLDILEKFNFQLRRIGAENRIEIHVPLGGRTTLEISAGGNPLNRGMWINKVKSAKDFDAIYETKFLNKVFSKRIHVGPFDVNSFIFEKAKFTIEIVKQHFQTLPPNGLI